MRFKERLKIVTTQAMQGRYIDSRCICRPRSAIQHGKFSKECSWFKRRQCHSMHVLIEHPNSHRPGLNYVKSIALITLIENCLTISKNYLINRLRKVLK